MNFIQIWNSDIFLRSLFSAARSKAQTAFSHDDPWYFSTAKKARIIDIFEKSAEVIKMPV